MERNIPQWKDFGRTSLISDSFVSEGQEITYHLPYQAQFTPYFRITVPGSAAGQTVTMLTETNGLSGTRGEYVTATGQYEYESYSWISGEELKIRFPAGVTVLDVGYRETGLAGAILDRLLHSATVLNIQGRSYRLKELDTQLQEQSSTTTGSSPAVAVAENHPGGPRSKI